MIDFVDSSVLDVKLHALEFYPNLDMPNSNWIARKRDLYEQLTLSTVVLRVLTPVTHRHKECELVNSPT